MDNTFPRQLFPHLYFDGPPDVQTKHNYGGWGSYERVLAVGAGLCDAEQSSTHPEFESQHTVSGEEWVPVRPAVTPLMPAFEGAKVTSVDLPDPMDFPEHMHYFYQHYCMDAFSTMGHLLYDNFSFRNKRGFMPMKWSRKFIKGLSYKRCEYGHYLKRIRRLHYLLRDIVSDVPPSLLSSLLYEELSSQREQKEFSSDSTGGALGYVPLYENGGCLVYPGGVRMDKLFFHSVVQQSNDDKPPSFVMQPKPFEFSLNGTIRQLSVGNMEDQGNVAVRSDYFCSVWVLGIKRRPLLVDVIQAKDRFTCVTASPHLPNELLVVNEWGAAYLWDAYKGLQKFREEHSNLYFNAKSPWRWCEFSCHPRVMIYADRTGAELTDIRSDNCSYTLFRIGKTPGCLSGERVLLSKYLGKNNANHHLINTQFSTYLMDERVPSVPMLKWNHMMESPPVFACGLPAQTPSQTSKLLLGSQRSQEIVLLQYKGGREQACQTQGPIQRLFSPKESLRHLDLQLPHKKHLAEERLSVAITGFTAIQKKDYLSVFQLTDTGDVFFQTLKLHKDQTTTNKDIPEQAVQSCANSDSQSSQSDSEIEGYQRAETRDGFFQTSNLLPNQTQTNKDVPKQAVSVERTVETGESLNFQSHANSGGQSSQSDSETEGRQTSLGNLIINDNVNNDHLNASDTNKDPLSSSVGNNPTCSTRPSIPKKDPDLQVAWNKWFEPIFKKASEKKHSYFRQIITDDLKGLKGKMRYNLIEDRSARLRRDLQEVMRKKELLSHGVTYLPHLDVMSVPDPVDTNNWGDDLSQRLAAAWEGDWNQWWEEKLGLNREKKIAALRRKRQRAKMARARRRMSLSGSFDTSISYQESVLGWSSAASQFQSSDDETLQKSQDMDMEEWRSRPEIQKKSPVILRRFLNDQFTVEEPIRSPPQSPQRRCDEDLLTSLSKSPSSFQVERPVSGTSSIAEGMDSGPRSASPTSTRTPVSQLKRRKESFLNSIPTSQTFSQNSAPDDGFSLSQVHLSTPTPSCRISLSSQRLSQFKSSSQASKTKKKSRMGF
ncbi:TATA box-binding protein-associated factor RNA polymerase I subunit C [Megalobrama amblycephala]|uniref:TATA box-binding protein-associated factor RNA polymerase I subunit C n=1 Tax=Megalobrama amblycephala TaxID=75352 RepID=UPI0020143BC1|nr:TATA box-binding protein-associated factor RNA polymerase I subunit C [Megalobrama amblycephala]